MKEERRRSKKKRNFCEYFKTLDLYGKQVTLTYKGDEYDIINAHTLQLIQNENRSKHFFRSFDDAYGLLYIQSSYSDK